MLDSNANNKVVNNWKVSRQAAILLSLYSLTQCREICTELHLLNGKG